MHICLMRYYKTVHGEKVSRRNVLTVKCPYGEVSSRRSVFTAKCPTAKCTTAKSLAAESPVTFLWTSTKTTTSVLETSHNFQKLTTLPASDLVRSPFPS